jgi:leucyl aminopeptidase
MKVIWQRTDPLQIVADWLVVGVFEGDDWLTPAAQRVDEASGGLIARLKQAEDFTGKSAELTPLAGIPGVRAERLLVVGLGKRTAFGAGPASTAARAASRHIAQKKRSRVAVALPTSDAADALRLVAAAVEGSIVGSHGQDLYKAKRKRHPFDELVLVPDQGTRDADIERGVRRGQVLGTAVNLTRDLVNQPPQALDPSGFAERAEAVAGELGVRCKVFDAARIRQERMGALLAVAAGSARPPRFVKLQYEGLPAHTGQRLALVGKGITFDSGGLSLKESEQMQDMKGDMAGAATVLAAMQAIAELRLPVRVLGLAALAENMPGPEAMKLGDVLTVRNGKTIEVLNTDAEGRLVLADALSYAVDQGASHIIDLATLTGSCMVALGKLVAGLMTNNEAWADRVRAAAERVGERVWQLPMFEDYSEQLQSGVADLKNIGTKWGGAITAAKFLENFVGNIPWAHLDIAGPAWASDDSPAQEAGGTGAFVRTLVELAESYPPS